MDVLEQEKLPVEERRRLLEDAEPEVRKIGEALINPDQPIEDPDVREAVESIRQWVRESMRSEQRHLYA
jgi:hypothetical protein